MGSRLFISVALISFGALSAANDFGADSQAAFLSADQAFVADVWMGFKIFIRIWILNLLLGVP